MNTQQHISPTQVKPSQKNEGLNWTHLGALFVAGAWAIFALHYGWSSFVTLLGGLVLVISWLVIGEWRWPHRPDWQAHAADRKRDLIFMLLLFVADACADLLIRGLVIVSNAQTPGPAAQLSLWLAVPAAVALGELGDYWLHRLKHRAGWLWQVHFIHHRPSRLNVTNNFTTHPLDLLLRKTIHVAPLWLLGFEPTAIVLAALFTQTQSFATHANSRGTLGWLNYLIGSAELHRWHHSVEINEAKNFGTALPLWDQLFGTFRRGSTEHTEPYKVGVISRPDQPDEHDVPGLLRYPVALFLPARKPPTMLKDLP